MRNLSSTIKAPQEKELSPNDSHVREPLAEDPQALVNPVDDSTPDNQSFVRHPGAEPPSTATCT